MAHQALYREWRPKVFDEVVEQKHAVYALRQSVISGQIAHAYLFSGTRGTGKTTLAKIFARAINCLRPEDGNPCNRCDICRGMFDGSLLDIVEMDAASNNSVDNIRRICDEIVFMPSQAKYKVYIIDEVHMLSAGAFNALLKTLEEPPAHAVFILATTEPHRIPATILSRCQRYEFRRLPVASIAARLEEIAKADGIDARPDALLAMASLADGAMRDAISLLDQSRASFPGEIGRDDVLALAGVVQDEFMQKMADALLRADAPALLELVDQLVMAGRDLPRFITDLAQFFRNILVCQVSENPHLLVRASSEALADMKKTAAQVAGSLVVDMIRGLSALLPDLRWAADARTALEIGLIRLMAFPPNAAAEPAKPDIRQFPGTGAAKQQQDIPPLTTQPSEPPDRMPAVDLWQKMLEALLADGQMTLYLFSRSARARYQGDSLELVFDPADQINCRETGQPASLKIFRGAAQRLAGREMDVRVILAAPPESDQAGCPTTGAAAYEDDWISKIKKTADTLNIPVKMEE